MCKFQLSSFKNLGGDSGRSQTLKTIPKLYRKYFVLCSADRKTRSIYDAPGYKKHVYTFLN